MITGNGHGTYAWADDKIAAYEAAHPDVYVTPPSVDSGKRGYWTAHDRSAGTNLAAERTLAGLFGTLATLLGDDGTEPPF